VALDTAGKRGFAVSTPFLRTLIPDGTIGSQDRFWLANWYFETVVVPQPWSGRGDLSCLYSGEGTVTSLYGASRGLLGPLYSGEGSVINR